MKASSHGIIHAGPTEVGVWARSLSFSVADAAFFESLDSASPASAQDGGEPRVDSAGANAASAAGALVAAMAARGAEARAAALLAGSAGSAGGEAAEAQGGAGAGVDDAPAAAVAAGRAREVVGTGADWARAAFPHPLVPPLPLRPSCRACEPTSVFSFFYCRGPPPLRVGWRRGAIRGMPRVHGQNGAPGGCEGAPTSSKCCVMAGRRRALRLSVFIDCCALSRGGSSEGVGTGYDVERMRLCSDAPHLCCRLPQASRLGAGRRRSAIAQLRCKHMDVDRVRC